MPDFKRWATFLVERLKKQYCLRTVEVGVCYLVVAIHAGLTSPVFFFGVVTFNTKSNDKK